MKLALYAHPFDLDALGPHGGLRRLADLGFTEIALATSYHDGRWLQPWHPRTRVRFLEDGTVHYRPRGDYGRLQPLVSTEVPADGPSPLERLCEAAPAAGLLVRAWNVFTHNSRLGLLHPDLCVENALGDRYVYALCPAQPEVQRYILAMVRDLGAHRGLGTIELEALGWMGWKHGSHHDKASFAPDGMLVYALSLCFCSACRAALKAGGGDVERLRAWARGLIRDHVERGDAMAPLPAPASADEAHVMATQRIATLRVLGAALQPGAGTALAVQVHPSPWFAGSQLALSQVSGIDAAEYVVTAYGEGPEAIARLLADDRLDASGPRRLSIWPKAPQFRSDEDLTKVRDLCRQRGISSIAIYHLGLLPWRTIERAAAALTA